MPRRATIHYRSPGASRAACGAGQNHTNFTLDVTCSTCKASTEFDRAHSEFMTVVDSWSSPKEEHPALSKLGHPERNHNDQPSVR